MAPGNIAEPPVIRDGDEFFVLGWSLVTCQSDDTGRVFLCIWWWGTVAHVQMGMGMVGRWGDVFGYWERGSVDSVLVGSCYFFLSFCCCCVWVLFWVSYARDAAAEVFFV